MQMMFDLSMMNGIYCCLSIDNDNYQLSTSSLTHKCFELLTLTVDRCIN